MKNLRGSVLTLLTAIVVAGITKPLPAQLPPQGLTPPSMMPAPSYMPPGMAGGPGWPAGGIPEMASMHNMPGMSPAGMGGYPPGYGQPMPPGYMPGAPMQPNWGVQPASYGQPQGFPGGQPQGFPGGQPSMPMQAGYPMPSPGGEYASYGGEGCGTCGGYGCDTCGAGHGRSAGAIASRMVGFFLPYGEGGPFAPRWYDITLDAMYLTRDQVSRTTNFASDGIAGNILLSTDDLNFEEELGFRFTGACQIFAGANLEFTYFGLFNWSSSALNRPAEFEDDIFSVLSDFGQDPFNGFDETDRSRQQSIGYSSTIDNFELNVRKRFTAPNRRLQYSWLAGIRYLYLLEDFNYMTIGGDADAVTPGLQSRGSMDYDVRARNSLTGFQVGGDAWLNIVPGVNIGADIKAGVYGNYANQNTNIVATTTAPANRAAFTEDVQRNDVALIADANLYFMWRLGPHWTVRAGYNFMYLDGVALAAENFNTVAPNILTGGAPVAARTSTLNDNGSAFYHGGFVGAEWMW